jgi:hypothetical protein
MAKTTQKASDKTQSAYNKNKMESKTADKQESKSYSARQSDANLIEQVGKQKLFRQKAT